MDTKFHIVNVEAAIYKDDKWLMIKRSEKETHAPGALAFVGGKVEEKGNYDHVLQKALAREIAEEVGIDVEEDMQYIDNSIFVSDRDHSVVNIMFLCKYKSGEPRIANYDEISGIFWMTSDEIHTHPDAKSWTIKGIELAEQVKKNQIDRATTHASI